MVIPAAGRAYNIPSARVRKRWFLSIFLGNHAWGPTWLCILFFCLKVGYFDFVKNILKRPLLVYTNHINNEAHASWLSGTPGLSMQYKLNVRKVSSELQVCQDFRDILITQSKVSYSMS